MTIQGKSLSVVVPALNEESNIRLAIENVLDVVKRHFQDFEILAFNDGSCDRTEQILNELAKDDSHIKVIHHPTNQGLGAVLKEAFTLASKDYVVFSSGDNSIHPKSFEELVTSIGKAEVIVGYMLPAKTRARIRRFFTCAYTKFLNVIFGLKLNYFNGPTVYATKDVQGVKIVSMRYECFSEALIRVLKTGKSYREIPFEHDSRNDRNSKAVSIRNISSGIKTLCILFWDINIRRRPKG